MICIYHSRDLDGIACGAIMQKRHPQARMIPYDYGEELPLVDNDYDNGIIMADVSLPLDAMLELAHNVHLRGHTFTWIDHHISIINEFKALQQETCILPVLNPKLAACELCWHHLFPHEDMPSAVELLGKYDSWRNEDKYEWDKLIMPFQYGMRLDCISLDTFPTFLLTERKKDRLIDDPYGYINEIMAKGETILKYQKTQNMQICRDGSFITMFEGTLKAICVNTPIYSSQVFESVWDPVSHDIMMPFSFKRGMWVVSLYTTHDHIDCSAIAKRWGGGGHRKAAGFQVRDITDVFPYINIK